MVITFSNIKGSTGGGGATGGTVSGITLWSDETTKAYIDSALSSVTDVLSAYTKTEDFATINGSAITSGGNLVIEATPYTAGTNIDITDHVISVTGITVPTSNTAFTNDAGYVTSGEVETQIAGKNYATESWVQDNVNLAIESETARTESTYAKIGDIPSLDGYATTGWVESQGYLTEHQDISGKLDASDFTAYTANTQTELNNKQDASAMTEYATTAFTESTYLKEHQSLSAYSTTEQVQTLIDTAKQEVENEIPDVSDFVTSAQVETQITDKGYITGYTETDPVFQASAASGITSQDISNWNAKLDSSDLEPYYTSAQTNNVIYDAVSGKANSSAVTAQISEVKAQIEAEIPSKVSDLQNDLNFASTGDVESMISGFTTSADVKTQIEGYNYINSGQAQTQIDNSISGKLDTDVFTAYTASTQTELNNKQDISGMTEYATTAFTESTYLKEHQSLSAYTPTSGFSTINGSAITEGGNLVIEETSYTAGANIDISTDNVISVTGITVPTKLSELTNDSGYINSVQAQTQIDNAVNGKQDTLVSGENIKTINNQSLLGSGNIEIQGGGETYSAGEGIGIDADNIISVTGNYETIVEITQAEYDALTSYGKNTTYVITDAPAVNLSAYTPTSGFSTINGNVITDGGNIVVGEMPYSGGTNIDITDHIISVTGITIPTSNTAFTNDAGYVNSGEVETQITSKGYITGFTESDPVFQASAASGITSQDITNWNNKLDSSALNPYYTSAQTDTAISNATSGKLDTSAISAYTKTEDFATINGSAITEGGNIVIQGGSSIENYQPLQVEYSPYYSFIDVYEINSVGKGQFYKRIAFDTINGNSIIHPSDNDKVNWTIPTSTSALTNDSGYVTTADTQNFITSGDAQTQINDSISGKQDTLVSGTNIKTINNESLLGSGNIVIQGGSGGGSYTAGNNIDITNDVISVTGLATINGSAITEGGNIEIQGGSGGSANIIELSQAEYDALTAYTEDAIYVITDSQAINMDNYVTTGALGSYYTSAETDTAISNAVSGKTDKISVTASSGGYKFPTWNNQGCITGTNGTAYQASQAINGSSRTLYSNSSSSLPTIYAPTSAGSAGQPLLSNGSGAPVWGAYKFQFISQSEYDALATKDSTTIYFIVNEN